MKTATQKIDSSVKSNSLKRTGEYLELITKTVALLVAASYSLGFLIWSTYLLSLGFFPNLFQGRYILTGFLFLLTLLTAIGFVLVIKILLEWLFAKIRFNSEIFAKKSELSEFIRFYSVVITGVFYLAVFIFFIFPHVNGAIGGGKPRLVAIMADPEEVSYLSNFGTGKASDFQTGVFCNAYDDNEYIVAVLPDRILSLKKDIYKGFVSLPNADEDKYINECNSTIITNFMKWRALELKK